MYALLSDEQTALKQVVDSLADAVGISNPTDLPGDAGRAWSAIDEVGLAELRVADDHGAPTGSGVDVMVAAQALGGGLVTAPLLAAVILPSDLLRLAGADAATIEALVARRDRYALLLSADLTRLATPDELATAWAWGDPAATELLALQSDADGHQLVRLHAADGIVRENTSIDLTRQLFRPGPVTGDRRAWPLAAADLDRWTALVLAALTADGVGVMRAALAKAVEHAKVRIAYGVPIGSFQAIQHLAAERLVDIEAAYAATCYAAWAVDEEEPATALLAARTAKAYTSEVLRPVTEAVMQIFGGVGQTWEHIAHLYTRRALLTVNLFGGADLHLARIADARFEGN